MIETLTSLPFAFMNVLTTLTTAWLSTQSLVMFHIPVKTQIRLMDSRSSLTTKFLVHPNLVKPLTAVFIELEQKQLLGEVKSFWGCYNPRKISGTDRWSSHASARACDFNADLLPHGTAARGFTSDFVEVWRKHGFVWGGDWKGSSRDPMHFEWRGGT